MRRKQLFAQFETRWIFLVEILKSRTSVLPSLMVVRRRMYSVGGARVIQYKVHRTGTRTCVGQQLAWYGPMVLESSILGSSFFFFAN